MLRFQLEPGERDLAIFHAALDDALNWLDFHHDYPEDFPISYPESAKCFTPALAEHTLKNVLRASHDSAFYQLTDYHWLLLYEVLWKFSEIFNDEPECVTGGKDLAIQYGIQEIDFSDFIGLYFWDIDFITNPDDLINMGEVGRKTMDFNREAYGVIQRWPPHPEELELTKLDSGENL
jgi:hypothetical protein